jgi:hypothetical protein
MGTTSTETIPPPGDGRVTGHNRPRTARGRRRSPTLAGVPTNRRPGRPTPGRAARVLAGARSRLGRDQQHVRRDAGGLLRPGIWPEAAPCGRGDPRRPDRRPLLLSAPGCRAGEVLGARSYGVSRGSASRRGASPGNGLQQRPHRPQVTRTHRASPSSSGQTRTPLLRVRGCRRSGRKRKVRPMPWGGKSSALVGATCAGSGAVAACPQAEQAAGTRPERRQAHPRHRSAPPGGQGAES